VECDSSGEKLRDGGALAVHHARHLVVGAVDDAGLADRVRVEALDLRQRRVRIVQVLPAAVKPAHQRAGLGVEVAQRRVGGGLQGEVVGAGEVVVDQRRLRARGRAQPELGLTLVVGDLRAGDEYGDQAKQERGGEGGVGEAAHAADHARPLARARALCGISAAPAADRPQPANEVSS
jgi:hypothetical protein